MSGTVVALLTSPGTPNLFSDSNVGITAADAGKNVVVVQAPGATLVGSSGLAAGAGAAAAGSVASAIVVTGVTHTDVMEFRNSRHGKTLSALFDHALGSSSSSDSKKSLILCIQGTDTVDQDALIEQVEAIFAASACTALAKASDAPKDAPLPTLSDLYDVEVATIMNSNDASKVMSMAQVAAGKSGEVVPNVVSAVAEAYVAGSAANKGGSATMTTTTADPPAVVEAMLACEDAFARHARTARAKLYAWKSRTSRGLRVEKFGALAEALLKRTMALYDNDTMAAAGYGSSVAPYRLEKRSKLVKKIETPIRQLFALQVSNLEKTTLQKFNAMLLRKHGKTSPATSDFYTENAAAMRSAAFAFDTAMTDLEIPSLSLTKAKPSQELNGKLNSLLTGFADSPAAKLKLMKAIKKGANKQKKPTERSIDAGLDIVAMIRPDGFGTFQGFTGYQLGGNSITVGVHNDADDPGVISQFGGVRPPFIRVQPKLRLDVEL